MPKIVRTGLIVILIAGCGPKVDRSAPPDSLPAPPEQAAADTSTPPPVVTPARPEPTPVVTAPRPAPRPPAIPSPKPPSKPAPAPAASPAPEPAVAPAVGAAIPAADPYHPAPRDTLEADSYQGWKQFELNCSRCHGEYAVGTSFAPALVVSLKEGGTIPTKEAFITTVCAGRMDKGMPSWCALGLEMDKIEQIYAYVKGRADGKIAAGRPAQRQ